MVESRYVALRFISLLCKVIAGLGFGFTAFLVIAFIRLATQYNGDAVFYGISRSTHFISTLIGSGPYIVFFASIACVVLVVAFVIDMSIVVEAHTRDITKILSALDVNGN